MNHVKAWHRLADGYDVTTVRIDAGGEPVEEREPTFVREASILVRARELWEQAASATGSMTTGSPSVISYDDVRRRPHQRPDAGRDRRSAANGCRQLQAAVIGTGVVTVRVMMHLPTRQASDHDHLHAAARTPCALLRAQPP